MALWTGLSELDWAAIFMVTSVLGQNCYNEGRTHFQGTENLA